MRNAKRQRRAMSPPEVKLWVLLRRSPNGIGFRRQHPSGPYVADFYCPAAKLVVEIDGLIHDSEGAADHDRRRDAYMSGLGLKVIRIAAVEVLRDSLGVADGLLSMCSNIVGPSTTPPGPSPG
jgi:very-short-patch-repair endonuclease